MKRLLFVLLFVAGCVPTPTPSSSVPTTTLPPTPFETLTPVMTATPGQSLGTRLPGEPDPALTPGAYYSVVTQATINSTICVSGWTATVRPPVSYTEPLKIKQIGQYGYADTNVADFEEDHLIPLELGGSPTDPGNLWPEPRTISYAGHDVGAAVKDGLENLYKTQVCAGTLTLAQARTEIGPEWVHYYTGVAP